MLQTRAGLKTGNPVGSGRDVFGGREELVGEEGKRKRGAFQKRRRSARKSDDSLHLRCVVAFCSKQTQKEEKKERCFVFFSCYFFFFSEGSIFQRVKVQEISYKTRRVIQVPFFSYYLGFLFFFGFALC
jgi:hypothetical protein